MMMTKKLTIEDFDLIQIVMIDMNGIPRGKLVPRTVARRSLGLEFGIIAHVMGTGTDLPYNVHEIIHSNFGNGLAVPDLDSLAELPWASRPGCRVGQVLCHMLYEDGRTEPTSPRNNAVRQIKKLELLGFKLSSSMTLQFTAYKSQDGKIVSFLGGNNHQTIATYCSIGVEDLMLGVCEQLRLAGVNVESWTSGGGPGSFELSLAVTDGVKAADMAYRLKHGVKAVMAKHGYQVTFMTHPCGTDIYSGCTFRFTAHNAIGGNMFHDDTADDKLSTLARNWISGMLQHGAGLTALCCPTVNCYSRLVHDVTSPKLVTWDLDNLSACVNVKVIGNDVWIENRIPSSASNPYLVLLATIAAGIDGIEKNMTCPDKFRSDALKAPQSLEEALVGLKTDKVLEEALMSLLLKAFLDIKSSSEVEKFKELETSDDKSEKTRQLEEHLYLSRI
ncbi:unnamed protein product [Lymnaea stagnalis]|uniref:Lengsin n=1 Tax=Lymnaea stagnalis TaxID=6523 RepID=A0AAV2I8K8_LYMST